MNNKHYKPLPGRGSTWTGPARLWLGEDHVLLVLNHMFVETYRRFFFADIQAIVVRPTHLGKVWSLVWFLGMAFFGGLAAIAGDPQGTAVLLALASPFAIGLIVNLLLGPTCACHIRTAVQSERVPALSRTRAARKFIARVEPLIVAAQGEWPGPSTSPEPQPPAAPATQPAPPSVA